MREVTAAQIEEKVYGLCLAAGRVLEEPAVAALKRAAQAEQSPHGREMLRQLVENVSVAAEYNLPLCQDTGMAVVFADVGQDVHIIGGLLADAVDAGVRRAYRDGHFRSSVLTPLRAGTPATTLRRCCIPGSWRVTPFISPWPPRALAART